MAPSSRSKGTLQLPGAAARIALDTIARLRAEGYTVGYDRTTGRVTLAPHARALQEESRLRGLIEPVRKEMVGWLRQEADPFRSGACIYAHHRWDGCWIVHPRAPEGTGLICLLCHPVLTHPDGRGPLFNPFVLTDAVSPT